MTRRALGMKIATLLAPLLRLTRQRYIAFPQRLQRHFAVLLRTGRRRLNALSLVAGLMILGGCAPLSYGESTWILEDLATGNGPSRFKLLTLDPQRRAITYEYNGRHYRGDLYLPGNAAGAAIVLVPGVVEQGGDDPRLVAFATTLARSRFLVLVPDIASLRQLKVRAEDAREVADAFSHLRSRAELPRDRPAGIGAFSYAVGPAVLAALAPQIREQVDFILGIGGYHDLEEVITFITTGYYRQWGRAYYRQPSRYGKWIFVLSNLERLPDKAERQTLRTLAKRKLQDPATSIDDLRPQLGEDGLALLALLENRDPQRVPALIAGLPTEIRAEIEALDLAGKDLSRLQARLLLLHGTDDPIIPHPQSQALAASAPPGHARLFLIDGLAHVDVRPRKLDRRALRQAIEALLAIRDAAGKTP